MPLSIIGAGWSRTGTLSLKRAIDQLGFGPCFHELDCNGTSKVISVYSSYPLVDWDEVFDGFNAAVDDPASVFYRELADKYPAAKVILTVREPNAWFASAEKLVGLFRSQPDAHLSKEAREVRKKMLSGAFGALIAEFSNFRDRESVIRAYQLHTAEVLRSIPSDRLLVFDVNQGWEPLCEFLRVPVPRVPFPHANTSADLQASFHRKVNQQSRKPPANS